MPSENIKILQVKQHQNSNKAPFISHADIKRLIEKINGCENNPKKKHLQDKQAKMLRQVLQCLQYHHLKAQKINIT